MKRWILAGFALWLAFGAGVGAASDGPDMLIITPKDLVEPAGLLAAHRGATGLRVRIEVLEDRVKEGVVSRTTLKNFIRDVHRDSGGRLKFLLLMGDGPEAGTDARLGRLRIPPFIVKPRYADSRWPYDKEIASDTWYGMLDEDLVPELAVGRLPADGKSDALVMVRKIIEYEESRDFGPWRKRVNVIAGTGGFGPMVDAFLEGTFRTYMTELLDPAFDVTLTYGNPRSPYCFPPPGFSEKVIERINAGSLVTAYVGHGSPGRFDSIQWKGKRFPICDARDVEKIEVRGGSPVVVIIACSTGYFDREGPDCISEKMMALERGPVAVFSSTRISHPYANGILGRELIVHLMQPVHRTVGEAILAVKKTLLHPEGKEQQVIDRFAGLIMKPGTLKPCREDHVHLYNLLGDPAMRLAYPKGKARIHAKETARFGEKIGVRCRLEAERTGQWILTLEAKRGELLEKPVPVKGLEGAEALKAMAENWKKANDPVVARAAGKLDGILVETALSIPEGAFPDGEYVIKFYAWGERFAALGHATLLMTGGKGEEEDEEDGF
ncbi:MAG: C25 family cysteine peptidase [Planctomycetota bacterium]|jgi:hypothetical protein